MSQTLSQKEDRKTYELSALGGEGIWTRDVGAGPRHQFSGFNSIPHLFKSSEYEFSVKDEIYDYDESLKRYRRIIAGFGRNGELPSGTWISSPVGDDITETNNMIEYGKGLVGQKIAYFSMEIALL
ncbi:MAG: hypothetical protein QXX41_10320, partial [Nitrososphaerota archaeon]